jgi:hypothetical protein
MRKLTIPNDELKELQGDILQYLYDLRRQNRIQISSVAHGFVPYHSCITSILKHDKESQIFVCADMLHAFDMLDPAFAEVKLLDGGVPPVYAKEIIGACSYENSLPQGGPASPYLLNIAMFDADCQIAAYAKKHGFQYTRYADDLVFSIKNADSEALKTLRQNEQKIIAELAKIRPLPEKPTKKQVERYEAAREKVMEKYRSKNPFVWFLYGVDTILQNTVNMRLNHKKDHVIFRGSKCKPYILGICIRQDGNGYNAERRFRAETRAGICNLWHKIFKDQKGVIQDTDYALWLHLKGRVMYCDNVRRASDEGYTTTDPVIQEKYYNPLERLFNTYEELQRQSCSRAQG